MQRVIIRDQASGSIHPVPKPIGIAGFIPWAIYVLKRLK